MKEFDSIRIVDKGGDSISFEMTGNVAGSPYNTIVFLLRALRGVPRILRPPDRSHAERREKMNCELMFSSKTDQWATPQDTFDELNKEFSFDLDPCADKQNHKCEKYFTVAEDGLKQNWGGTACFVTLRMGGI